MARYRRYRRTIVRAPKKKWCSNMKNVFFTKQNTGSSAANIADEMTLAENSIESVSIPTPVVVKTGNFKLQADFYLYYSTTITDFATQAYARIFIIYTPEGVVPSSPTYANLSTLITNHPEWILAWRYVDVKQGAISPNTVGDGTKISMSSRLKRNLNSGDKIRVIFLMDSLPASATVNVRGMCQFWTCAN